MFIDLSVLPQHKEGVRLVVLCVCASRSQPNHGLVHQAGAQQAAEPLGGAGGGGVQEETLYVEWGEIILAKQTLLLQSFL